MRTSGPLAIDLDQLVARTWIDKAHYFEEVESTNTLALGHARSTSESHAELFLAGRQTSGRGRGSNRWWSADGALTFSVLTGPLSIPIEHTPQASLAVGVALCQAVEAQTSGHRVQLKWPNDVYVDGRKLAGVLIELPAQGPRRMVIGVGMNVGNSLAEAPAEIRLTAASLVDLLASGGKLPLGPTELLAECLNCMRDRLDELAAGSHQLPDLWRRYSLLTGHEVEITLPGGTISGRCTSIADDGALLVETAAGIESCHGGVVSRWHRGGTP